MAKRIGSLVTLLVLVLTECFTPMCCVLAENNAEPDFEVEEIIGETTDTEEFEEVEEVEEIEEITEEPTEIEETKEIIEETINTEEIGEITEEPTEIEEAEDFVEETIDTEKVETTEDIEPDDSEAELNKTENENTDETISENEIIEDETEGKDIQNLNDESFKTDPKQDENDKESNNNTPTDSQSTGQTSLQVNTTINAPQNDANKEKENIEEPEGTIDTITEEIKEIINKIRYFFKSEGDSQYIKYGKDKNNIGTITLKDPKSGASITIMDKNLGADNVDDNGHYFQWGNNHGVKAVDSNNKTVEKAIYNDSYYNYGYDGQGLFIIGNSDYWENGNHYNSLWGNETKESSRYGACPVGYHIPTIKEWNQLLTIWGKIHTQDTSTNEMVLRYSANYSTKNIHTFKGAATQCSQGDTECVDEDKLSIIIDTLSSELKLPLAGSYDENGNFQDGLGIYWTSISKNGNSAGVFDVDAYIGEKTDEKSLYKAQGHTIRCFQNIEPYEAPIISEPENNESSGMGTNNPEESPLVTGDIQGEVNSNAETQNNGENAQDSHLENDIPSDIEPDSIIQDTTGDTVNEEINTKEYTITRKNEDGSIRDTTTVAYGEMPIHEDPFQPPDTHYSYEFAGWEPELKVVEGDAEYKAKYSYIPMEYTITWENEDGTIIDTTKVAYGQTPTHKDPIQPADEKYSYKFAGWEPKLSEVKGNTEYRAKYEYIVNKFTITWQNKDGTEIDSTEVPYGEMPTHEDPFQPADTHYSYEFSGWEPEISEAIGNTEYRAKYKYILKKYTITWENEDGNILKTDEMEYGSTPIYSGEIPTKESTEESTYEFAGREPEIGEVKGDIEYVAIFNQISPTHLYQEEQYSQGNEGNSSLIKEGNHEVVEDLDSSANKSTSKGQTGDIESGSALDLLEEILDDQTETGEVLEYTDEDRELELAQIRNTLNKKKIKGKETYNNITVNVEAPKGAFPEGVELRINPIIGDAENQAIKEQLMENTEVTEDSELVSFDISFIYTLSNGEEVELQPRDGNTVKVSFNYKNNNKFNKGKKEKNKDLKIYHFEKVKYKKDKKSEKTQIKEIKINESESTESEIVIDADSFSVYSVALVDGAGEEQDNFDVPMLKAISNTSVDPGWNRDNSKGTVTITLNANGGSFSNSSSTKNLDYGYYTRTETKYAHTSNYNDNGTSNGNCSSSDEKTTTVEIAGATKLDIEVSYGLSRTILGSDSLRIVADGIDRTFSNSTNSWEGSTNGNSVSFTLNLAGRIFSGYPKGYYAVIVGTIPVGWRTQDNVEEPTREGYEFVDWYTDTSYTTVFDDENYNFENGGTTVYAKWTCAEGYTEVGGECKKDCNVPASLGGGTIHHGQSVTGYQSASVPYGQTCQSEARICNNGTLEGSYTYQSCQTEQPTGCTLPWGGTTGHGAIVTAYTTSSVTCPTTCTGATATCNNGVWSVNNFTGTYTNQTCTTNPSTCDTSFTLNSTGANGTYSGCTSYTVNANSCNEGTTKYKLTNCANGYHTEDNSTCVSNSKQVACAQNGKPANSSYVAGDVTVTWQGTWNSGNWSATGSCAWICDPHYHTGANNNSCEIDTFQITWKDGNGSTLKTDTVNYNVVPTYSGPTPTKTATAQYSYTFNAWSPTPVAATADATYTAQFNQTVNQYNVTFDANGGTPTPAAQSIAYGQTATKPIDPINTGYVLASWQLSGSNFDFSTPITGAINLVAQWRDAIPPTCTITQAACTSGALQLTLTGSEALQTPTGWTKVNDMKYTLNVTSNDQVTANIMDIAGNTGSCSITPTNYDAIGPGVPTLTIPENNAYINEEYPYFAWTPGNISGCATFSSYEFQGCYDSGCSNVILTVTGITNTGGTIFSIGVSAEDGTYYWRVREKDSLSKYSDWSLTNKITIDSTKPTCTISQDPATPTNGNVTLTAIITETNKDKYSWTGWSDMATTQTTWTLSENGNKTFYMQDKAGNTGSCSITVSNIDREGPTGTLSTTSTLKTGTQRLTGTCTDTVGVTAYYLGTKVSPSASDYKTVTSATSYTTGMNVTDAGTYYLYCKDVAGNVSIGTTQTYYTYTVHNMEETADGTTTSYNTTNYTQISNNTYIAPAGTSITLESVYDNPNASCDTFKGVSTSAPSSTTASVSMTAPTLNENANYGMWFARNTYALSLVAGTGTQSPTGAGTYKWGKNVAIDVVVKNGYTWSTWTKTAGIDLTTFTPATKSQTVTMACGDTTLRAETIRNEYTITYNLNGGTETVANPTTYTTESEAITLQQPIKTGYTFLGWTGSNGNTPQTGVVIPTGSHGNKTYNAVWQANTTEYVVYHYVKKVGESSYALSKTDILSGTTDELLILSSLAKESEFMCAHYSSGSLSGTENGPGEIITQTNLKGDGTTKIYLYYTRNSYTVTLSGDEHIQMLKINGNETNQATLECGSNVPVEAVPKPGYHIVRWDRDIEREERENGD